uniref:Pre-mRNA-splicing factor 18 n=1 Tax=Phlebotomus papatasi TaxID=29031 RepID=A0A1B0DEH6_PHLPP
MKPLFRKLKNKTLPEDILDSLTDIARAVLERNYIAASDAYLQMAIGNAPWPIGVTMVGIHARTGREKIFSKNVAHVLNDETQRKYIQGLKRLMTKCQEFFPTDPSRCVEYDDKRKYFKRGELLAKEKEEYFQRYGQREEQAETQSSGNCVTSTDVTSEHSILPRPEVIRRLRERCEPILLFGETEHEAFRRLRQCEITEPEINRGFRNDFQEAMEQVDQAYLDEILTSHGAESSSSRDKTSTDDFHVDDSVSWETIQEMAKRLGRGNKDHDMNVITTLLQYLLKLWNKEIVNF